MSKSVGACNRRGFHHTDRALRLRPPHAELKCKIPLLKKKAAEFDSKKVASWGEGERVPFIFLCLAFDQISNDTGRIVITDIVCNALRTVMTFLQLCTRWPIGLHRLTRDWSWELGMPRSSRRSLRLELGDLGLVAKASRSSQSTMRKPDLLTVAKVFDTFRLIAK
ncbi:hypothetical protein CRG98_050171, partial [Punica granatum]